MNKTQKTQLWQKIISFVILLAIVLTAMPYFEIPVFAGESAKGDKDVEQILGWGYDVTSGALKKSNLRKIKPILNLSSDIYEHVNDTAVSESQAENIIAYSAQEVAEKTGHFYSAGIGGKISAVNLDISASFDRNNAVSTAVAERYELYYYNIYAKIWDLGLELPELRNYLSEDFKRDLFAVKNENQAIQLLNKYGTHLITGYKLGGRMEVTNYQTKSSFQKSWAYTNELQQQLSLAKATASANESFSLTQYYTQGYNTTTESSAYSFRSLGGLAVDAMTVDQLFTYNPSIADGKGNYIYDRWVHSINEGVNLDIVDISNSGKAIPLWDLLPTGSQYNMIRRYLLSAYITKCGDKYGEFCKKYPALYAEATEDGSETHGDVDIEGFYGISKTCIVSKVLFEDADTSSTVTPGTVIAMILKNSTVDANEKREWGISSGSQYATVEDALNGVFKINDGVTNGTKVEIYAKVNGEIKATWTFEVKESNYSGGEGTENSPYIIATSKDLYKMSINKEDWTAHFVLADDIKIEDKLGVIGTESNQFSGVFDGNYCTISGLKRGTYENPETDKYLGLFGVVKGEIKNLILDAPNAYGTANIGDVDDNGVLKVCAGALVGKNEGTVSNCIVKNPTTILRYEHDKINDDKLSKNSTSGVVLYAGGLVGENEGVVSNCGVIAPTVRAMAAFSAWEKEGNGILTTETCAAGGMIGYSGGGKYEYCYVKTEMARGAAGEIDSSVTGKLTNKNKTHIAANNYAGGMIGYAAGSGTLDQCIIDVPNEISARRQNCAKNESKRGSGTLVGYVDADAADTFKCTSVFTHAPRTVRATDSALNNFYYAATKNGAGNEEGISPGGTDNFHALGKDEKVTTNNTNIKNIVSASKSKWTNEADGVEGTFPVLKSFAFKEMKVNARNKNDVGTNFVKDTFYHGEAFSPEKLEVSLIPDYGKDSDGAISINTYKINYSSYNRLYDEHESANGYAITVSLSNDFGKYSKTYKVYVKKCDIIYFEAEDAGTGDIFVDDIYSKDTRDIKITAKLSNGELIDPIAQSDLSYVNYPKGTFTIALENASNGKQYPVVGKNKVNVSYNGLTNTYIIEAKERTLTKLEIVSMPSRMNYLIGEEFSADGMQIKAIYEDGLEKIVDNAELELYGTTISDGENKIFVSYDAYVTTEEPITVNGVAPFYISKLPDKTEYNVGDKLDLTGLEMMETKDGETYQPLDVTKCVVSPDRVTSVGENTITITYQNYTVSFTVTGETKHYPGPWEILVPSTCQKEGTEVRKCNECHEIVESRPLEKAPHTYEDTVVPATPTEKGYTLHTCTVCTYSYKDNYTDYVDETAIKLTIESKRVVAGNTFTIDVLLENNSGISYLEVTPVIPSELTLVSAENGEIFDDMTKGKQYLWTIDGNEAATANGKLMTFEFTTSKDIPAGDYEIKFIFRSCLDYDENEVAVVLTNGVVKVLDFIYGDANGDGVVNGKDIAKLIKYWANYDYDTGTSEFEVSPGADANGDGVINGADIARLKKYWANYDYDTGTSTVKLGPAS